MKKNYYLYTMNMTTMTIISLLLAIIGCIPIFIINVSLDGFYVSLALYIFLLFIHEIIHSIAYVINGADFKRVTYGCHIEKGILCCLCKQDITRKNILISLISPFVFLSLILGIISIIINSDVLFFLALYNFSGCAGDFVMFFNFLKIKDFKFSEYDDPISFALIGNDELKNRKMFGLKYVSKETTLKRDDLKKIDINLFNVIFLILYLFITIGILI